MDTTETIIVPELFGEQLKKGNGNGNLHMLKPREDGSSLSAYQSGLAAGMEEGYGRGYREGFSDGSKLAIPSGAAAAPRYTPTAPAIKAAMYGPRRLRGLPCSECGCASYTDEVKCPSCGTPKMGTVEGQPPGVEAEGSQHKSRPGRRGRARSARV